MDSVVSIWKNRIIARNRLNQEGGGGIIIKDIKFDKEVSNKPFKKCYNKQLDYLFGIEKRRH